MKRKEAPGDRAEGDTIQAHTACTVVSSAVPGHELLLYFESSGRSETVGEARAEKTSTKEVSCSSTETLIRAVQAHAERWTQAIASVDLFEDLRATPLRASAATCHTPTYVA
jgi:hypothetical protein